MTQINAYDDHGIPQGKTPSGALYPNGTATANFGRFGYTGQAWLHEIGLNYYKARMYSPPLGRFMQTDPIGYGDGPNLYAYVDGDPVNRVDSNGTEGREISLGGLTVSVSSDRISASLTCVGSAVSDSAGVLVGIIARTNTASRDNRIQAHPIRLHRADFHPLYKNVLL